MISRFKRQQGFTLIELLLVLFIIGFTSGLVIVAISGTGANAAIRGEAMDVFNTLKHLRERSIIERSPFALVADKTNGTYSVLKNGKPEKGPRLVRPGVRIDGGPIVFYSRGSAAGPPFVVIDASGKGFSIEVNQVTGAAEIKRIQSP